MNAYIFSYYLIQFCGHSWIFTNIIIRFLSFGEDSVVDTFYSIGLVMSICQLASILELFHIHLGIEEDRFLPRLLQITERIVILFVVIASQEEVQGKYVVCILFFLWSFMDVIRYTFCMLAATGIYFQQLTWIHYSLWIPLHGNIICRCILHCPAPSYGTEKTSRKQPWQSKEELTPGQQGKWLKTYC
ncbi:very-long-chain (3R)-3-hydroxyacyl-CoA dehydratase 4 isoform X2 [Pogona vitticeps]|uniref:Very-long-chain (3R)-3-hydroxyacyl-CoA dehydratase n=1 Tax=Pogona vitticeps TaxID=103695 RepID=A0ABM5FRZ2_9SAUR